MTVARWLRGRTKLAVVLGLLKDQTAVGIARASGSFSHLQFATVMATNHQEILPEENSVKDSLAAGAGSDASLFLHAPSCKTSQEDTELGRGREVPRHFASVYAGRRILVSRFAYLQFSSRRQGVSPFFQVQPGFGVFVVGKDYAQYLDERLRCAHALKTHVDHRWKAEIAQNRVEYLESEELLYQLESLQNLLQELYQCDPGAEAGEHPVIPGPRVSGYKVVSEIRFRIQELLGRVDVLALSESLAVLHKCKRATIQMQALETFLENCKALRSLPDVPLPGKGMVSKLELQKLTESIQSLQKEPSVPLFTRSVSSGGQGVTGRPPSPKHSSTAITNRRCRCSHDLALFPRRRNQLVAELWFRFPVRFCPVAAMSRLDCHTDFHVEQLEFDDAR